MAKTIKSILVSGNGTLNGNLTIVGNLSSSTSSKITLRSNNIVGEAPSIADDSVYSFTPSNPIGIIVISARNTSYAAAWGIVQYRTTSTVFTTAMAVSASMNVTTGILSGTTGADNKITVSTHTDGKIYIENRLAVSISINYVLMGM